MMKRVTREGRMIRLDIHFYFVLQAKLHQETVNGRDIEIVLMLSRLRRLRLDQERALEAALVLVLHDHAKKTPQLVALALKVSVEERIVPFAAAPQHIIIAAQARSGFHCVEDLRRGKGEYIGIRIRGRPGRIARIREQVRRAPERLDARLLLPS